jgi:DNA-directed RNA polymerase subunit RPC12/RpoP
VAEHTSEIETCLLFKGKIKLQDAPPHINVKIITILGAIAVAVVFFFAVIFALAASVQATLTRLVTSGILFVIGVAIIVGIYYTTRKPKTVIQRLEVSGQMTAVPIKCPNCSASVDANRIKIVSGVPYATCPYCGTTFEVTEEPKW